MWAAFSSKVTPAHQKRGWRSHLTICEARQGIYRVRILSIYVESYHLRESLGC